LEALEAGQRPTRKPDEPYFNGFSVVGKIGAIVGDDGAGANSDDVAEPGGPAPTGPIAIGSADGVPGDMVAVETTLSGFRPGASAAASR